MFLCGAGNAVCGPICEKPAPIRGTLRRILLGSPWGHFFDVEIPIAATIFTGQISQETGIFRIQLWADTEFDAVNSCPATVGLAEMGHLVVTDAVVLVGVAEEIDNCGSQLESHHQCGNMIRAAGGTAFVDEVIGQPFVRLICPIDILITSTAVPGISLGVVIDDLELLCRLEQ